MLIWTLGRYDLMIPVVLTGPRLPYAVGLTIAAEELLALPDSFGHDSSAFSHLSRLLNQS
jgi:hypothetical protein